MSASPASLGDSGTIPFTKVRETVELPKSRKALVSTIEAILESGKVQKIVVEVGKPIVVEKYVEGASGPPLDETPPDDFFMAARNAEMIEIPEADTPLESLLLAFDELFNRGLKPKAFLTKTAWSVSQWLGLGGPRLSNILGIELIPVKDLPMDVVLLLASLETDPDVVTLSIRIPIPLAKEATSKEEG